MIRQDQSRAIFLAPNRLDSTQSLRPGGRFLGETCPFNDGFDCLPLNSPAQAAFAYEAGYQAAISQMFMMMQMQFMLMQAGSNRMQFYPGLPMQEFQDPCTGLDQSFVQCLPQDVDSRRLLEQERRREAQLEERIRRLEEELSKEKKTGSKPSPKIEPKPGGGEPKPATPSPTAEVKPKGESELHAERVDKFTQDLLKSGKSMNADSIKLAGLSAGLQQWEVDGLIKCLDDSHGSVGDFTDPRQKDMLSVWNQANHCNGNMQELAKTLTSYSWAEGTKHTNMSKDVFNSLAWAAGSPKGYEQLRDSLGSINGWGGGGVNFDKDDVRQNLQQWSAAPVQAPSAADAPATNRSAQEIHDARVDKLRQDLLRSGSSLDADKIKAMAASAGLQPWEADGLIKCLDDSHGTVGDFTNPKQVDMLEVWAQASKCNGDSHKLAQALLSYSWREGTKHTNMSKDAFHSLVWAAGTPAGSDGLEAALGSISGWGWGGVNLDREDVRANLNLR
jgi:hypothetical protein